MRWHPPFLLFAALGACGENAAPDVAVQSEQAAPPVRPTPEVPRLNLAAISTLAGEWRVAGIDGQDFNEPVGLALSGSDVELWWEPRCAEMVRSYRITGLGIAFGPRLDAPPPPEAGAPPPPVCAVGLPPRLHEAMRAIDAADTVGRTEQNGVLLSGGGHSLLLFSQ